MLKLLERKISFKKSRRSKINSTSSILIKSEIIFFETFLSARSTNLFDQFFNFIFTDLKISATN